MSNIIQIFYHEEKNLVNKNFIIYQIGEGLCYLSHTEAKKSQPL